eukprot:IDg17560t1
MQVPCADFNTGSGKASSAPILIFLQIMIETVHSSKIQGPLSGCTSKSLTLIPPNFTALHCDRCNQRRNVLRSLRMGASRRTIWDSLSTDLSFVGPPLTCIISPY